MSDLHQGRAQQADLPLSNLARHKAHEALLALLEVQDHHQPYSKAFRHAMRCVYSLRHLQEEAHSWPVDPYPTAEKLHLKCVSRTIPDGGVLRIMSTDSICKTGTTITVRISKFLG